MAAKKKAKKATKKKRKAAKKPAAKKTAAKRASAAKKKPAAPKRGRGRPKEPVPADVIEDLLEHIYSGGSLVSFGDLQDTPARRTLYKWMHKDKDFRAQVQRAQEDRAEILVQEALAIADNKDRDTVTRVGRDGKEYEAANHEWMQRSKIRVDLRMRMAACLNKQWSPNARIEHNAGESFDAILHRALGLDTATEGDDE